jgi:undecaprenyl-diphosphatase
MLVVAKIRVPWLTAIAVDVTALGSITLVTLFAALMFVVLLALRNRIGALQLAIASIGAAFWTEVTKNIIERARPEVIPRLVEVSGSSYPSGHSLAATSTYFTIAILVGHRLESAPARIAILAMAGLMIVLVAFSRVYLGVHYPTDVAGGVALGGAWGFFVAGTFSLIGHRRDR